MATATQEPGTETEGHEQDHEAGDEVVQMSIEGDGDLSLTIGGRRPDKAALAFGGGEVQMSRGELKKGQRVAVLLVGDITEVTVKDLKDPKTKMFLSAKRTHKLTPDDVQRIPLELVDRLLTGGE